MNDMRSVIAPKSDQINADDLLAGPITITIREVSIRPGTEQPVSISFDGDNGKPYKCCKSMARVMVHCWGADANEYIGRSMRLYCDPKVLWGGMAVGGIRISHMSHIKSAVTMALTATKGSKKPFTVQPLKIEEPAGDMLPAAETAAKGGVIAYQAFWKALTKPQREALVPDHERLKLIAKTVDEDMARKAAEADEDIPFDDDTKPGTIRTEAPDASQDEAA